VSGAFRWTSRTEIDKLAAFSRVAAQWFWGNASNVRWRHDGTPWRSDRLVRQAEWCQPKILQNIIAAAAIPLLAGAGLPFAPAGVPSWVLGILGALIVIVEGLQQLNQYHANWIS
jgi:hypothetical protein